MRVITIFVRHGTQKYPQAERELADLFRAQLPHVEREIVVVDTALSAREHEVRPGRVVIGGDNSAWEFSGFESGLSYIGDRVRNYDLVNLATSAFRQLYQGYLERFRREVLESVVGRTVCLGHIDCYNETIEIMGCESQHWVRTSCLFVPPVHLLNLGTIISTREPQTWFTGNSTKPFRRDAPLSANYSRLITDWLTGQDIGQGISWHSPFALNGPNLDRFQQKAIAILNEHLFAVRLRATGCQTIDVTWLSGLLAKRSDVSVDWRTPWWRQLAERDRDALRVNVTTPRAYPDVRGS